MFCSADADLSKIPFWYNCKYSNKNQQINLLKLIVKTVLIKCRKRKKAIFLHERMWKFKKLARQKIKCSA